MALDVVKALAEVRWEVARDEDFAMAVADAFHRGARARVVELGWGDVSFVVDLQDDAPSVSSGRASGSLEPGLQRRPRKGWPGEAGAAVGAPSRLVLRVPARHVQAWAVVWMGRVSERPAWEGSAAAALGVLLDARVLLGRVAQLSRSAHSDNRTLRRALQDVVDPRVVASSPAMRAALERADAVASFDTPVLISGPSGAGKEVLARRIHARSARAEGPFVALNCGAIPSSLAESELFGHVRGAFTGATHARRGVFERARGGTLLLDEVGELSAATQVKLLRVLQEQTFTPLGSEQVRRTNARVIAATHRDLSAAVAGGSFREDLFYRLAVFEVAVPALAERPEDIPGLVQAIVRRLAHRMQRPQPTVPRSVLADLVARPWPGNVRELENVLEGALIMSPTDILVLPLHRPSPRAESVSTVQPLDESIRAAIEAALSASRGKVYGTGGAAEMLGLHPATLQSKMRKLGIQRAHFVP